MDRTGKRCKDVWNCYRFQLFIDSGGRVLMDGETHPKTPAEWKAKNCRLACVTVRQKMQELEDLCDPNGPAPGGPQRQAEARQQAAESGQRQRWTACWVEG